MAKIYDIHPQNPQNRLIAQAADLLRAGAVAAIPTDCCFVLACHLDNKDAIERIRQIRHLDKHHHFTLMCRDLSELGKFALVSTPQYRLLRASTPGAYTFILPASHEVPRRLYHPKRKTIGLRIPEHVICQHLLAVLDEPLLTVTLMLPDYPEPLTNAEEIEAHLGKQLDLIIGGVSACIDSTTVIDLEHATPQILRVGNGDPTPFEV